MSNWSPPDARGICTLSLDVGAKRTLRGKRLKRAFLAPPKDLRVLGEDQLEIVRMWVGTTSSRRKWNSMLAPCSFSQATTAPKTLDLLAEYGWVMVEEKRSTRGWEPTWVEFLDLEGLRERLGLTNRAKQKTEAEELVGNFQHDLIQGVFETLLTAPPASRIKRHELLQELDLWVVEQREGTRRDFALAARGDTKGITTSEWQWLESALPLESLGIVKHTPQIRLRFPGQLIFPDGPLDGRVLKGILGLDPVDFSRIITTGQIPGGVVWRVRENFTTFQKTAAEHGDKSIVVWVPGFAPPWWLRSIQTLLDAAPGPLEVGCDPDPAGVMIALQVAGLWEKRGLSWSTVGMTGDDIKGAPSVKELSPADWVAIERLLSDEKAVRFSGFLEAMKYLGVKAEQEGIV